MIIVIYRKQGRRTAMKKLIAVATVIFAGIMGVSAQIGLNQTECQTIYGGEKRGGNGQEWEKQTFYRPPVFTTVGFVNNKAVAVLFKSEKTFSCADVRNILVKNGLCIVGDQTPYTVVKGDCPWKIGKKFGTCASEIIKLNGLDKNKVLSVGQKLKIPFPKHCACLGDVRQNILTSPDALCVSKNASPGEAGYADTGWCCADGSCKYCKMGAMKCSKFGCACHPCECAKWSGKGINVTLNAARNEILVISNEYMGFIANHPMAKSDFELSITEK